MDKKRDQQRLRYEIRVAARVPRRLGRNPFFALITEIMAGRRTLCSGAHALLTGSADSEKEEDIPWAI
jgi:hypothetical protein